MNDPWCDGRHEPKDCGDEWCDVREEYMAPERPSFVRVVEAVMPEAMPVPTNDARSVWCQTCGARVGYACDQSKVAGSLDGFHAARVRLLTEGPARRASREVDEYNQAVRQRDRRGGWR